MFFETSCCHGATRFYRTDDDRLLTYFFGSVEEERGNIQGLDGRKLRLIQFNLRWIHVIK